MTAKEKEEALRFLADLNPCVGCRRVDCPMFMYDCKDYNSYDNLYNIIKGAK